MIKNWANNVNKRILRNGAGWDSPSNFIEDTTRSGKRKRRLYATQQKKTFQIKMMFTLEEYAIFDEWFREVLKFGLYSFYFPRIDSSANTNAVYKIAQGGDPKYSNPSGRMIECTMVWEEA